MATTRRKKRRDGDSPITVGGGGGRRNRRTRGDEVYCDFDDSANGYPEPAGGAGPKRFAHAGWLMRTLTIAVAGRTVDLSPFLPDDGDCEVKVKCRGAGDDVTINGADPLRIEMNTGTYNRRTGTKHENPDLDSYVYEVEVSIPSRSPRFSLTRKFSRGDACRVVVDHVAPTRRLSARKAKR
jgi:hypothetical protein